MKENLYIDKNGKKLRCGFTTGSCAAAASKAALIMLLNDTKIHNVTIVTPKGPVYNAEIVDIDRQSDYVSCAVIKDGGDDPDVTTGSRIFAKVQLINEDEIRILGGEGVGRVTKPGLDQPIGEAAINSVPRKMIRENIEEILDKEGVTGKGVQITISVPGGEELAKKTFNPKLGIVGGISILGTTGVVEPMSDEALLATIETEIKVRHAEGRKVLLVAPGNYGITFLNKEYGIDDNIAVMCSNFVYDAVQLAGKYGFKKLLFVGHIGKLVKVAGGIKNTHSMYGDHRMEILTDIATKYASKDICPDMTKRLSDCVMTDEAVDIIKEYGLENQVFPEMARRIKKYMEDFSDGEISVESVVFSNEYTKLTETDKAEEFIRAL